jgi:beta-glucosidase
MPHEIEDSRPNGLLGKLTIDEKISLLSAKNVWETQEIERVGIPSLKVDAAARLP